MTNKDIGRAVGKSDSAVHHALDPERGRAKLRKSSRPHSNPNRDWQRMHARAEARHRWRAEGRVRPLERYYRDLECL